MEKPKCFGYYHPKETECKTNCSFIKQCRLYQEEHILPKIYEKHLKEKEIPKGLRLEDMLIDDDIFK